MTNTTTTAPTRVDFYRLKQADTHSVDNIIATLCEKIVNAGQQCFILTQTSAQAQRLDEWLWVYHDQRFLAHTRLPNLAGEVAITLGHEQPLTPTRDCILHLSTNTPAFVGEFARILYIVPALQALREFCRQQYKTYQQAGCDVRVHEVGS